MLGDWETTCEKRWIFLLKEDAKMDKRINNKGQNRSELSYRNLELAPLQDKIKENHLDGLYT